MKTATSLAVAFAFMAAGVESSMALGYCSEPSAPFCATRYGEFDDEYDFDSCRRDMENYASEVEEYIACLQREVDDVVAEAQRESESALSEYNDAVDSFNRRARGGF
jgi:hypothetical protein